MTGSVQEVNGVTTIKFTRAFNAGFNPIINPKLVPIITSTHDTEDAIAYHSCSAGSLVVINLLDGGGSEISEVDLKSIHGSLMIVGWGFFLVLGKLFSPQTRPSLPLPLILSFTQISTCCDFSFLAFSLLFIPSRNSTFPFFPKPNQMFMKERLLPDMQGRH